MSFENPARKVQDVLDQVVSRARQALDPGAGKIPGAPGSEPPSLEEPTEPRTVPPPKPEHGAPTVRTATGTPTGAPPGARAQQGEYLTTSQGLRLYDTDHSLKAGHRGPTLLQDHHLREKITHFHLTGVEGSPGVISGQDGVSVLDEIGEHLAAHRVWERFTPAVAVP